jgi:hypothetical protein
MRNVVFVAPYPLATTLRFARALASLDNVRLLGLYTKPPGGDDARRFADAVRVEDLLDPRQILAGVRALMRRHGPIHRLIGILEPIQGPLAEVRAALGIDGADPETTERFRDKATMKDALRAEGLPCAEHARIASLEEARAFVARVGYPVIVKPLAGMGCRSTWRIHHPPQLEAAVHALGVSPAYPAIIEEFLSGREFSFETVTVGGIPQFCSFTEYLPPPLQAVENDWIQWTVLHPRTIDGPAFDDARAIGIRAVRALGLRSGFSHMEWFRRADGSLAIGEIAARPPGAQIVAGNNWVHDADLHRAWARAVVDDAFDGPWERKYAVGVAFLRGAGRGRVAGVTGVEEANRRVGSIVVASQLPRIGAPKSDSYEGDGFVIVRHPQTEVVEDALQVLIRTLRTHYRDA